jgi:hypothetical protein
MAWIKAFNWKKTGYVEPYEIVKTLGLERRNNFRIGYPERGAIGDLPTMTYAGNVLHIKNVSIGGCCILDPDEVLGTAVGNEISVKVDWANESHHVRSRIVSRVENQRHLQFLDMSEKNQKRIGNYIEPAFRGGALRRVESGSGSLKVEACEIWVSALEDSITIFDHPQLLGSCLLNKQEFLCYRHTMPVYGNNRDNPVPPEVYEYLVLYVTNVAKPSPAMQKFSQELCLIGQERFR